MCWRVFIILWKMNKFTAPFMCSHTASLRCHTGGGTVNANPMYTAALQTMPTNSSLQEGVLLLCHVMMNYTNKVESAYYHYFVLHTHSPWKQRNIDKSPLYCVWNSLGSARLLSFCFVLVLFLRLLHDLCASQTW